MPNESSATLLKTVRRKLQISQKRLAEQFNASQSQVSRWEAGEDLPPNVLEWVKTNADNLNEVPGEGSPGTTSLLYSYPVATFRRLWDESPKRMKHLHVQAVVKPSTTNPGFADAKMILTIQGLQVPRKDSLYLDCLGVLPKLSHIIHDTNEYLGFKESETSALKIVRWDAKRAKVKEFTEVHDLIGPHALGYEISKVDEADEIVIEIDADRGVRLKGIDAIGAPVYADCVVASLSVGVTFAGLRPDTLPKAEVYLLRRTLVESRPLDLAGDLDHHVVEGQEDKHLEYAFEKLLYPKAGYGYCIAWDTLKLVDKVGPSKK